MADINIFALGGQDENGKNSFVIESDSEKFLVNCGIKVPIINRNGIDAIIPEYEYVKQNIKTFQGVFITHAHDENFAALPWLIMECPGLKIYGSAFTIEVAKERVEKYKIGHSNFSFHVLEENSSTRFKSVNVKTFGLASSIPGAFAYNFQTPDGDIIFVSNFVDGDLGTFGKTNLSFIKENSNEVLALILDSRISIKKGKSSDKKSVVPFIEKEFANLDENQRIIIGSYDEEMYNLIEVLALAKKYNRPLIIYGKVFNELYSKIRKNEDIPVPDIVSYQKTKDFDNAIILVTSTWSRLYKRFTRIAQDNDIYLKLKKSDKIIMMAPPINGMEVEYSESLDEIAKLSPNIIDISENDLYELRPAKQDINDIVRILKPKFFVPISSLYRYQVVAGEEAKLQGVRNDKVLILTNGKIAYIKDKELASQKSKIENFGDVIIDGFGVGDISFEVIKERKTLGAGGLISISILIDKNKKQILGEPNIQVVGVVIKNDIPNIQKEVNSIIIQKIEEAEKFDFREVQNAIRKRVQKTLSRMIDKEPLVVITFNEL